MTPLDIARVQAYLRKLFSNNLIRIILKGCGLTPTI